MLDSIDENQVRPLLRSEYDELIRQGHFEGEKIELLFGVLVRMTPIGSPHASTIARLNRLFTTLLPEERASVRPQLPFAALPDSEPEPDLVLAPPGTYSRQHPEKTLLVIEVAASSLARDRGLKARLYALAGVPEYWIVNLVDEVLEVHTEPCDGVFGRCATLRKGDVVRPLAFPDLEVRIDQILE